MQVTQGISNDYAKDKFSITLDETDLIRIANEYGLAQTPEQLTTVQVMLLLTTEAERFVLVQAPKYGRDVETVRRQIQENREQFATALTLATGLTLEETRKKIGSE
jgi:hypothetical protein